MAKSEASLELEPFVGDSSVQPVEESELMRTMTDFTEFTLQSDEAERLVEERNGIVCRQPKYRLFSKPNKEMRKRVFKQYAAIVLVLMAFILGVWSIYWGSMYNRQTRYVNLNVLVSVESNLSAPITQAIIDTANDPRMAALAGWDIKTWMEPSDVIKAVHDQHYWGSIYLSDADVSEIINEGFQSGSNVNLTGMIHSYFETGRDLNTLTSTIKPAIYLFGNVLQEYLQSVAYPQFTEPLSDNQFIAVKNTNLNNNFPTVIFTDGAPVTNPVVFATLQVGLIYIIIITFFQFMWFAKLNTTVGKVTCAKDYVLYRMLSAQVNYLFLSLAFACLNAAFQIPMNNTWSGGFGILWMIAFLVMNAVGGANENVALICFSTFPPVFGFWLLFFVMINISATFSAIEVCPGFYKFTYAMPIKSGFELMKVLVFNTSKHNVGRDFGILSAWIALNNLLMPFCIMFFASRMKKQAIAEYNAKMEAARQINESQLKY